MNKLQKLGASIETTDPWPERRIPRYAVLAAQAGLKPKRRWWHWLRALLPVVALAGASVACAITIVIDQHGRVVTTYPWPTDRDVIIPVIVPSLFRELGYRPTPAPYSTPRPVIVGSPNSTPRPL